MDKVFALETPVQEHTYFFLEGDTLIPHLLHLIMHIMDWCEEVGVFFRNNLGLMSPEIADVIRLEAADHVHWANL